MPCRICSVSAALDIAAAFNRMPPKRRGVVLGGDRGVVPSAKTRAKTLAAIEKRVAGRAADIAPAILELQAAGATSLNGIAAGLNERGIETARGGQWTATQVSRLLSRL